MISTFGEENLALNAPLEPVRQHNLTRFFAPKVEIMISDISALICEIEVLSGSQNLEPLFHHDGQWDIFTTREKHWDEPWI